MQLTWRSFLLLITVLLLMGLSALWQGFLALSAIALLLTLILMLADWRLTPDANAWSLQRHHDQRLSLAAWNRVVVQVHLRHGPRALKIWLRDTPPVTFHLRPAIPILTGQITPGTPQTLRYHVRPPRRGDYTFGDLYLRWESTLGLWRRQARFPAEEPVKVYPNLTDVRKYDLLVRQNRLWEMGLRHTPILGMGTEFERLRDYQPDDDYRRINWKATARRGKPITMEYETERSQNLVAMLDVGRMMRSPVGDVARLDYAINAVLLLAYVASQKGDRVGLCTFAHDVQAWMTPRAGRGQFLRMLEMLYAVESQPIEPNYNTALGFLASKQRKRSLVLVFTDITGNIGIETLIAQLTRLRRQHLPLLILISDPTIQRMAHQPIRDSTSLYQRTVAEQLLQERQLTLERLRRAGVLTLDAPADRLSIAVIDKYLALKARELA